MKVTTNNAITIIAAMTIIDIAYTTYGAFYGGGGAELNPLFSWARDPTTFVIVVIAGKTIGIGAIIYLLRWIDKQDCTLSHRLCCYTSITYGCLLCAVVAANVMFVLAGG